jgi:hypothetical protein
LTKADAVLARYGWNAAIYIPTGSVGLPGRLSWDQLRELQASGRWQIEEHAGDGHVYVDVDASGTRMPFYSARRWVDGKQESFAEYKRRVSDDIEFGAEMLRRHLPGWATHGTFAVPYGDYGQRRSNDRRIASWFGSFLKSRFAVTFVQARDTFATPGLGFAARMPVPSTWDTGMLETHLLRGVERLRRSGGRPGHASGN